MEFLFLWLLLIILSYKFGKRRGRAEAEAAAKDADESLIVDETQELIDRGVTGSALIGVEKPHKD